MRKLWIAVSLAGALLSGGVVRAAESSLSVSGSEPGAILSGGLGLIFYSNEYSQRFNSGTMGRSINASILSRVGNSSFYWGVDFALNFWSYNTEFPQPTVELSRGAIGIQPLLAVQYRFAPINRTSIYPYFGLAVGPQLYLQRNRTTNSATTTAESNNNTSLYLQFMAKPGVELRFSNWFAVMVEPKFGLLATDFILQPTVSAALML